MNAVLDSEKNDSLLDSTDNNYVFYNGKKYIKTETKDEVILTSVELRNNKKTILSFTKNKELGKETEKNVVNMIKKSILNNYYKNIQA